MKAPEQAAHSIRLLIAGVISLLLLGWTLAGPGLPPVIIPSGQSVSPGPVLFTALLATGTLVLLCPVCFRGRSGERWVSVLLGLFPFLVLSWVVLWVAGVLQRGPT